MCTYLVEELPNVFLYFPVDMSSDHILDGRIKSEF